MKIGGYIWFLVGMLVMLLIIVAVSLSHASSGIFLNLLCSDKQMQFHYVPAACPKGFSKVTSRLQTNGTRRVTLTCEG